MVSDMSTEQARTRPAVSVIVDEFTAMSDDEYTAALRAWLEESADGQPVCASVSAADTLREIRDQGET